MLKEGDKAPAFSLKDHEGKTVRLQEFKGRTVVVYFYPKDNTPGCTKEACGFRDVYDQILAKGAAVIGISPDSETSHRKFRERQGLPFYLLADLEHKTAEAYSAWGEKTLYGRKYFGILRTTFIVDKEGRIAKIFPKVKPENHGQEVLAALDGR
jgi:peroxiredoxin Q/BCP